MKMRSVLAIWSAVSLTALARAAPVYQVTDLGTLGGSTSTAYGINAQGQVVGSAYLPGNTTYHAFKYDGVMHDLGTLPGGTYSAAYGLNNAGQVVGYGNAAGEPQAFISSAGNLQSLGIASSESVAFAVSPSGLTVGYYFLPGGGRHAYSWLNGVFHDLGALNGGSYSEALAVNAGDQIVGYDFAAQGGVSRSVLYQGGGPLTDLGVAGEATGINASGQICGYSLQAYLLSNGQVTSLGTLGGARSWAYGINASGSVVGAAGLASNVNHAFLYDGAMHDLNSLLQPGSGWTLEAAYAINDSGQIVGYGLNPAGQSHAYLLTPVIPEPVPTSLVLLTALYLKKRRF